MPNINNRRFFNFIMDKDLQLRIMANGIIYMICVAIITLGIVLLPIINDMGLSSDLEVQYRAAQNFLIIVKRIVPGIIFFFVLFTAYQLILTHRICGPLINFSNVFAMIAQGDLSRQVRVRKHDYLKEESEHINQMIMALAGIMERLGKDHNKLKADLERIACDIRDNATKEHIEQSLEIIKADAEYVSRNLARFKTNKIE